MSDVSGRYIPDVVLIGSECKVWYNQIIRVRILRLKDIVLVRECRRHDRKLCFGVPGVYREPYRAPHRAVHRTVQ